MEDGLSSADRVLMICTERYVEMADGALGGVGYENMISTAELIRDLLQGFAGPRARKQLVERFAALPLLVPIIATTSTPPGFGIVVAVRVSK